MAGYAALLGLKIQSQLIENGACGDFSEGRVELKTRFGLQRMVGEKLAAKQFLFVQAPMAQQGMRGLGLRTRFKPLSRKLAGGQQKKHKGGEEGFVHLRFSRS